MIRRGRAGSSRWLRVGTLTALCLSAAACQDVANTRHYCQRRAYSEFGRNEIANETEASIVRQLYQKCLRQNGLIDDTSLPSR